MSALVQRVCAFAVGATAGCTSGMAYLHKEIHRAHAAVGRSMDELEKALKTPSASAPVDSTAIVAASPGEGRLS